MTRYLQHRLLRRKTNGNLRQLHLTDSPIDFSSNDYLGLAHSLKLEESVLEERNKYSHLNWLGSTGSRLLSGNCLYAEQLEEKIATFHGYEAGLLFSCGYMANIGLLSAVTHDKDCIFFDAAIHASTHDGIRLSRAKAFSFRHNDLNHLEKRLRNCGSTADRFICIESIYSTDGSIAPLVEICQLAKKYAAHLIVDEAHAVGVCGPQGAGLVAQHHLMDDVFAQVTTFGKALGTYGAIVLGNHLLKEALINFATSYIYTTALPFQALSAIKCSYDVFPQMDQQRQHIAKLATRCCLTYPNSFQTHIQSIPMRGNLVAKKTSEALAKKGFDVRALLSPTVQRGNEMLRICLHACNTEEELTRLLDEIIAFSLQESL